MIQSYKELIVWQKAIELVTALYNLTDGFPKEEIYCLTSQMRRAAISIPSNIAEGRLRGSKKEYLKFLRISYSSGAELETQVEIAKRLSKTKHSDFQQVDVLLLEVMKMLNSMLVKLRS